MHKIQFTRPVSPYLNGEIASFDEATAQAHVRAGRALFVGGPAPKQPVAPVEAPVIVADESPVVVAEPEIRAAVVETPADKMLTTGRAGRPRR